MMAGSSLIKIVCVDDNPEVTTALASLLNADSGFDWKGGLDSADQLIDHCVKDQPDLVLIDLDMPGRNPLDALVELVAACPGTPRLKFSGPVGREQIERALNSRALGYVSKNHTEEKIFLAQRRVSRGEKGMIDKLAGSARRLESLPEPKAMAESFLIGGEAIRTLVLDPLLPEPIAPVLERKRLLETLREYDRLGRRCWAGFMRSHGALQQRAPHHMGALDAPALAATFGANP